jgi:hypothetical protein
MPTSEKNAIILDSYIPEEYISEKHSGYYLICSPSELPENREFAVINISIALERFENWLGSTLKRNLYFCMYIHPNDLVCSTANTPVKSLSALCVPCCSDKGSLITFYGPDLHLLNADAGRMQRHYIHELVHVWVAEYSRTEKLLGAGSKLNYPFGEGLEEGIAETVSLYLSNEKQKLNDCFAFFIKHKRLHHNNSDLSGNAQLSDTEFYKYWTGYINSIITSPKKTEIEKILNSAPRL